MERIPRRTFLGAIPAGVVASQGVASFWAARESCASETASHGLDLDRLAGTHDLRLPDWGCYTKDYNGISHLANKKLGLRFDLSVLPGFFRRGVLVPNVNWESGYHPWDAATDLSYFSYRYELEWKDRVYCDVSFSALSEHARLVRAEFVNRTPVCQNMVLHYMASMRYPRLSSVEEEPLRRAVVSLPPGGLWIDALDYQELKFARPRPTDSLVWGAQRRGELRGHGFVNGSGVGQGFGKDSGDKIDYGIVITKRFDRAILLLRYRKLPTGAAQFRLGGVASGEILLETGEGFAVAQVELGRLAAGTHQFSLESIGKNPAELDGLVIVEADKREDARFFLAPLEFIPRITEGPVPSSRLLKYPDSDNFYGIAWDFDDAQVRELQSSELDRCLRRGIHDHVHSVLVGDRKGHFTNVFLRPIPVQPRSSRVVYGIVACGSKSQIAEEIRPICLGNEVLHRCYLVAKTKAVEIGSSPAGEPYRFSQERMAATVLTNVVYPIYIKRSYIRHFTPGKWWDSLYTWDSGFTGLGLAELDLNRAIDCLNAYVTQPGDAEAAFVHYGTPLPVQIYLFQDLWNRTQSQDLLAYFYPRLRQYHLFLAGRLGTSTTRKFKSGLLNTWDYFYNTGWDDYPAQVFMHAKKMAGRVAPSITTVHAIRTARILRWAAESLTATADLSGYDEDIEAWTQSLQKHSWDSESGYFSYVVHDDRGKPVDILRHDSGRNFNMGMDGVSPLIAGVCSRDQTERLLGHLRAGQELWTPIGLTAVDQSAPYYRKDGYWNGAVWFPHQWFLWKALLDLGEAGFAFTIADTALNVWKNEVNETYHCFEHFLVESRRGAGWHQFSGLSSPILSWFGAYYRPGRLTTGLDAWIRRQEVSPNATSLKAGIHLTGQRNGSAVVLATMNPARKYRAFWKGKRVPATEAPSGTLQIQLPANDGLGTLSIEAI